MLMSFQSREELAVSQRCHSSEVLNLNNPLNIKIRKKLEEFLILYNIKKILSYNNGTYFPSTLYIYIYIYIYKGS